MNFDYIHVNSKDRTASSNSSTDFEVLLSQALEFDEIQLNTLQMPYTYYNVNSTNDLLVINWNGANHNLTVTNGNYSLNELQTELNSLVQTINSSITVTLDTNLWMFTFNFASANPSTGSLILSQSTINRLIGFNTNTDTSASSYITSTVPAMFLDQSFLFISITTIGNNVTSTTASNSYSFYVPITVNGGDLLTYTSNLDLDNKFKVSTKTKYFSFRIRVYDTFGNILDINNSDWSMILKVFYKNRS